MITSKVDFDGYQNFMAKYAGAIDKAVGAASNVMQTAIIKSYQRTGPLPGVKQGTAGQNIPSAPGEPPAIQFGLLRNSTLSMPITEMVWGVYAGTNYAKPLEFGTTKMASRPFMLPAMNSKQNQRRALNGAVKILRVQLMNIAKGAK